MYWLIKKCLFHIYTETSKMAFSGIPACEDSVDRFNQTWLVYFLLFMAALTFILPFGVSQSGEVKRLVDLPRYTSACWCPAQFTNHYIEYAKTVCRHAFERVQSGQEVSEEKNSIAVLYKTWHLNKKEQKERYVAKNSNNSSTTGEFGEHELKGTVNFLFENTPVFLFLSAVCVMSFVLFMSWYGVNVSGLIQRWQILYQNHDSREQERRNLINIVSERFGSSRRLTSGYFIYKLVIWFLCVLFTLIVNMYFIPSIQMAQSQLYLNSHQLRHNSSSDTFESVGLTCEFTVEVGQSKYSHSIPCSFTQTPVSDMRPDHSDEAVTDRTLNLYGSIFRGLFFTFIIISTINAVNITMWMVKLCRNRCFPSSKLTLSLYASLLVHLMKQHINLGASKALEDSVVTRALKPMQIRQGRQQTWSREALLN